MTEDVLLFETMGPVARLTLNRPKSMNSLNLAIMAEVDRRLTEIAANDEVRVLILTGSGTAFCAGADLKEVLASQALGPGDADFLDCANAVFGRLRNFPKPVIAALNGVTMAGGLELAMCADLVVAAESTTIAANTAAATSNAYAAGVATGTANTTAAYSSDYAAGSANAGAAPPVGTTTTTVTTTTTTYAMGVHYAALPAGSMAINKNGTAYYLSGNTWFKPSYGANGVYYTVVPTP